MPYLLRQAPLHATCCSPCQALGFFFLLLAGSFVHEAARQAKQLQCCSPSRLLLLPPFEMAHELVDLLVPVTEMTPMFAVCAFLSHLFWEVQTLTFLCQRRDAEFRVFPTSPPSSRCWWKRVHELCGTKKACVVASSALWRPRQASTVCSAHACLVRSGPMTTFGRGPSSIPVKLDEGP